MLSKILTNKYQLKMTHFYIRNNIFTIAYLPVFISPGAVSSAIKSRKLLEVSGFESVMVPVHRAHDARPGLSENEITLALAVDLLSRFVEERGNHAKKRKRRRSRLHRRRA